MLIQMCTKVITHSAYLMNELNDLNILIAKIIKYAVLLDNWVLVEVKTIEWMLNQHLHNLMEMCIYYCK